jgi:hypothetical protein
MNEEAAKALAAAPTGATLEKPLRRVRYRGRNPRHFREKYKEFQPDRYSDNVAKVIAGGKTPAGTHWPVMLAEILGVLVPRPGEVAVDCTFLLGSIARATVGTSWTTRSGSARSTSSAWTTAAGTTRASAAYRLPLRLLLVIEDLLEPRIHVFLKRLDLSFLLGGEVQS